MAVVVYGNYILISRPNYHKDLGAWIPDATISWNEDSDGFHYHEFDLAKTFATADQALAYGLAVARNWIDQARWN